MILNSRLFCLHISSATGIIGCASVSRLCGASCMIGMHATTELHPLPQEDIFSSFDARFQEELTVPVSLESSGAVLWTPHYG